jgi:hypothetical protein
MTEKFMTLLYVLSFKFIRTQNVIYKEVQCEIYYNESNKDHNLLIRKFLYDMIRENINYLACKCNDATI